MPKRKSKRTSRKRKTSRTTLKRVSTRRPSRRTSRKTSRRSSRSPRKTEFLFRFSDKTENNVPSVGWVIYFKKGCPYCDKAKTFLKNKNENVKLIDGENLKNFESIIGYEYKWWPKIFYNGKFIGGYSDLENKYKDIKNE